MYKYLLDKDKNLFYPLIDDKSIVNVNTINDAQIEELFNPMVEDILIEDEYRFSIGQYPSASIEVECIPERAGKYAYLDAITSNPDSCVIVSVDKNIITLDTLSRGESTITITETYSGISKDIKVVVQPTPQLYVSCENEGWVETWSIKESLEQSTFHVEAWSYSGYQFNHWSDGNAENPREITIYEDTELTAFFAPILYNVEVRSSNEEWGTVSGGGQFMYNSEIMISAIPNSGYKFVLWSDGDTNPERWVWIYGDVVYEAIFEALNPNLIIYYTSNDGQVILPKTTNFGANLVENTYTNGQGTMIFDASITSIGDLTFSGRSSLTSVTIPNSVTSIGNYAFDKCSSLTSITIGNGVTTIGAYAFYRCSSLTSVTIPNSVTSIREAAFSGCASLISVILGSGVTSLGFRVFNDNPAITSIVVDANNPKYDSRYNCNAIIETLTGTLIAGCQNTIIPNDITSIGREAFYYCSTLTSITIPNSVTSIGYAAFQYCPSLTSIVIPDSVTSIRSSAFESCNSLTSITCEATTPPTLGAGNNLSNVTAVYVPAESVNLYKQATNWSYYSNIITSIPS